MTDDAWIDTVRVARDMGTVQQLLPKHVTSLLDAPYRLLEAIRMALLVCGWEDNLERHEMPPKRIWNDSKALKGWMDDLRRKRKGGGGGGGDDEPVQNEAAKALIVGG